MSRVLSTATSARALTTTGAVLAAVAAATGAVAAMPVPRIACFVVVGVALLHRRPVVFVVGVGLLASSLAADAHAGLHLDGAGQLGGVATAVSDPRPLGRGTRIDVSLGGHRYEARAHGAEGHRLAELRAGERVELVGDATPSSVRDRRWHRPRHVAGRLEVERVGRVQSGHPLTRVAGAVRDALERGADAAGLDPRDRALFLGLTVGDDRGQSAEVRDQFLAAGLTHLLAVSGSNVAFVLLLAGPVIRRGGLRWRLAATATALVVFGTLTRWEPSVTRAIAMAGLATLAMTLGRPVSGLRLLALAVAGLLLIDPLLVHRVGFLLSVGASAGIAVLGGPISTRLPGPRWLREPLGVTLAAQIGVAPVQVPVFGALPLASIPANLAAGPVAGVSMVWGMLGGGLAGVAPGLAPVLHVPTRCVTAWLAGVARVTAGWGLPAMDLRGLTVLVGVVGVVAVCGRIVHLGDGRAIA